MSGEPDLSRLPAGDDYWRDLESRIVTALAPVVHAMPHAAAQGWWAPLAARAWPLGALAAAAAIAALVVGPARTPSSDASGAAGLLTMPRGDPVFAAFVAAPSPPPVGALVIANGGPLR